MRKHTTPAKDSILKIEFGAFGPIYRQFKHKAKSAIEFLKIHKGGEAIAALYHPQIGFIDLVWGNEGSSKSDGFGLAKLQKYHPEVLENMQTVIAKMKVTNETKNRVQIEDDKYKGSVRLYWNENRKKWLLTLFEKKQPN